MDVPSRKQNHMDSPQPASTRGRPRTITMERITEAGIAIGLPNLTFVGLAGALGVSQMALYKHLPGLGAVKRVVAEEMFRRWQIPQASGDETTELKDYLLVFSDAVRVFVKEHPGATPYVLRRMAATQAMIDKIHAHQRHIAQAYGLPEAHAQWLLATVAFQCFAAAHTVYSVAGQEPTPEADRATEQAEMEGELVQGMQALVVGALALLPAGEPLTFTSRKPTGM